MDEEINIEEIKQKATLSVVFLTLRNLGLQAFSFVGFFILTILMGPSEVGLFSIVTTSIGILGYFSDFGLASALIQQKDEVQTNELRTVFLIQQLIVVTALIIIFFIFPSLSLSHHWGNKELWITVALGFAFLMSSLKTIPSVLLERRLNYKIISTIDVTQNIIYYVIAVFFAFLHFGAYSFAIATAASSIVGLIFIYSQCPWPIGISFSLPAAKKLFRFGIPFQLNTFIALAKDRFSSLFVAGIIGRESFGILSFAQKGPSIPQSFMDPIMRVTFPTFSRLQQHPELLKKSLERSLFIITFFAFPVLVGISVVASPLINLIPKYGKWLPAIIPLYFYAYNTAVAVVTTPLTNAFNAIGKIKLTTKFMIMWTVLTWIFYPLLSIKFGYIGTAIAVAIVGSSSFIVWYFADRLFSTNIFKTIFHPLASSLLMLSVLLIISSLGLNPYLKVSAEILIGVLIYITYHLLFSRQQLAWFVHQVKWARNQK